MSEQWTDQLAGARMQVDKQFNDRIIQSEFTNQEWGLIMTAVEFEVENPDSPDAKLVANTDNLPEILPHLEEIEDGMGGPPGGTSQGGSGGVVGRLGKYLKGFTGGSESGVDEEKLQAATSLVEEYTAELQAFLEEQNRWDKLREQAADQS